MHDRADEERATSLKCVRHVPPQVGSVIEVLLVAAHEEEQERLFYVFVTKNGGREGLCDA